MEKNLEFVLYKGVSSVLISPSLMLLSPEIEPLSEEQNRKKYALVALSISRFEIVLALPAEVIAFHMQAPMV